MVIIISHRGCTLGPNKERENHPDFIQETIDFGFFVECDFRFINNKFYLGHDDAQYEVDKNWITSRKGKLFCHAKNIEALSELIKLDVECFSHEEDACVLTSKNRIWTYPGIVPLFERSITVMPEKIKDFDKMIPKNIFGICTDYAYEYRKKFQQ